jgi:copper chaperone CopZ
MMTINKYSVSGMSCGACVSRVKTALSPFAESVEVSLQPPEVVLTQPTANIETLNRALDKIGNYVLMQK